MKNSAERCLFTPLTSNGGDWQAAPSITMSLLFWNVRGLGNRRTIQELEKYIRAQDPTAFFLAETWVGEARLKSLCLELGFDQHWVTPQVNRLGCLALFCNNSIKIEVISSSPNHINSVVGASMDNRWRLTGIYG